MTAKKTAGPAKGPAPQLPPDVTAADLKWPKTPEYGTPAYREWLKVIDEIRRRTDAGQLTFYHVPAGRKAPDWVLTTLRIGGAGRGATERYYGVGVADGKVYTVGRGPHVAAVVTIHLHPGNWDRLRKYADLYEKGMADAQAVRDRISSRRAQGQLHRAAGRTHWYW